MIDGSSFRTLFMMTYEGFFDAAVGEQMGMTKPSINHHPNVTSQKLIKQ
jgi:hypothetical protein